MKNGAGTQVTKAMTISWSSSQSRERLLTAATGVAALLLWGAVGCHKTSAQNPGSFSYQNNAQYQGQPDYQNGENGNLAPVDPRNEAQQQADQYQQQGAPIDRRYAGANGYPQGDPNGNYDPNYEQDATDQAQAVYEADLTDEQSMQAPPPLPYYDQPEAPDADYIWTPGYWAWSPVGYYWVPGAWVEPPYIGALWTPGYWDFYDGFYRFHHGYWGLHIGFYGGINYGYGYTGYGYYGGYWRDNHFYYNRVVNRIDARRINRVYDFRINVPVFAGRPSFNGPRGITVRPRPAEVAVMHERRYAPLPSQLQLRQQSMQNRAQFFNQNRGRPAVTVDTRPVTSNHQMPAQLPAFQGRGTQGFRQGNGGGFSQPGQTPIQPNSQGRVVPQQGRQPQFGVQPQVPGQPQVQRPTQPQQPQLQQQFGRPVQPAQAVPAQPTPQTQPQQGNFGLRPGQQQSTPQAQPQPGNFGQRPGQQQGAPQPQPQPNQQFRRGPDGRVNQPFQPPTVQPAPQPQAQPQQPQLQQQFRRMPDPRTNGPAPAQAAPQPQPQQPQLQQQFRRMPESRPQAAPQPQAQPQPQPQQQFRRGPEGVRANPQPQNGQGRDGRGDHNR